MGSQTYYAPAGRGFLRNRPVVEVDCTKKEEKIKPAHKLHTLNAWVRRKAALRIHRKHTTIWQCCIVWSLECDTRCHLEQQPIGMHGGSLTRLGRRPRLDLYIYIHIYIHTPKWRNTMWEDRDVVLMRAYTIEIQPKHHALMKTEKSALS